MAAGARLLRERARRLLEQARLLPGDRRRQITDLVNTLPDPPLLELLDEPPVRVTKRLDDSVGRRALELIRSAARRSSA